jgi:PKD repeat protein
MQKSFALAGILAALMLAPRCVNEQNPYLDVQKTGCVFAKLPPDTVEIFSTFQFSIEVLLAGNLQSVSLHVDDNRLWGSADTTFGRNMIESLENMRLSVSFADTGLHEMRCVGRLTNGDSIVHRDTLYARSPLDQRDTIVEYGTVVTLQTSPVDDDVSYVWDLKQGQSFERLQPTVSFTVNGLLEEINAELHVESKTARSPSQHFTITLRGLPPSLIQPIVPSRWQDTVGASSLKIRIGAIDGAGLSSVSLNDAMMTRDQADGTFFRMMVFNEGRNVVRIKSIDNTGNGRIDSLVIFFAPNAPDNLPPQISIKAPGNLAHIAEGSVTVRGSAFDAGGISSLKVNGIEASRDYPYWSVPLQLSHGCDTLRVVVVDSSRNRNAAADSVVVTQNTPPAFTPSAGAFDTLLPVAQPYTITVHATDLDQDALSFQPLKIAQGSTFGASNGAAIISYTPAQPGLDTFMLAVNDVWGGGDTVTWRVIVTAPGESAPFFVTDAATLPETVTAFGLYSASVRALDPGKRSMTYALLKPPAPAGMTIDSAGTVRWAPLEGDTGSARVLVQASNGIGHDTLDWNVTVHPFDWPPVLLNPGAKTVDKAEELQFALAASDKNGDLLDFQFGATFPTGARLDGNIFTWSPGVNVAGQYGRYAAEFIVRESNRLPALSDTEKILITVINTSGPPGLITPGDTAIVVANTMVFTLSAVYRDTARLTYSMLNAPQGAALALNRFSWTPDSLQVGRHAVTFVVKDTSEPAMSDSATVIITVVQANIAPALVDPGNQTVDENSLLQFKLSAIDANSDSIGFSVINLPEGARLAGNQFSWTPTYRQAGTHTITFFATDNGAPSLKDSQTVIITVRDVNAPPVLDKPGDKLMSVKQTLAFTLAATDVDNNMLSYMMANGPAGATLIEKTFTWTPTVAQVGNYQVSFIVTDNGIPARGDLAIITISVNNGNIAPILTNPGNQVVNEKELLQFALVTTDLNNDPLIYSMINGPREASLNGSQFRWTPTYTQAGKYSLQFVVADNGTPALADTESIIIIVSNVNQTPVANAGADQIVGVDTIVLLDGSKSFDPDSQSAALTYLWKQTLGAAVSLTGSTTAQASFTPAIAGSYTFRLTVSDGAAEHSDSVTINAAVLKNLLTNGDFSNDSTKWTTQVVSPATGSISFGAGVAHFRINTVGGQSWHFQLYQKIAVVKGKSYNYIFSARKIQDAEHTIKFVIIDESYRPVSDATKTVTLNNNWATFSGSFTATGSRAVRVGVQAGLSNCDIEVDNFIVTQQP